MSRLRIRPHQPSDAARLIAAAQQDRHHVLAPTFVIEKHDDIVGYVGFHLPIWQGWADTRQMATRDSLEVFDFVHAESRRLGWRAIGFVIPPGDPFERAIQHPRLDYRFLANVNLSLKTL